MKSDEFLTEVVSMIQQARNAPAPPVGTKDNPYVVVVPKWFEERCIAEGHSPQQVYDAVFAGSSFRHGRVEVLDDYRQN